MQEWVFVPSKKRTVPGGNVSFENIEGRFTWAPAFNARFLMMELASSNSSMVGFRPRALQIQYKVA